MSPMLDPMVHRGPDDRGVEVLADGALVFGHLRLSILDLSPLGHQPMSTADSQICIVFNGEIYNFREIRRDLESLGHSFRSDSDTEVILAAYRVWGLDCVVRLRGMFAFAIWDLRSRQLHLVRDRFGVKPLHFSLITGQLAFASELKGLICSGHTTRKVDFSSALEFVQYGYVSAPRTILGDVQSVSPGVILSFDAKLTVTERRYWRAQDMYDSKDADVRRKELLSLQEDELLDRIEESLQSAFAYRMVSDVPVGVFLSGGIDSSLVATLLTKRAGFRLKTFTIGFGSSEFDETPYARAVARALGSEHTEFAVTPDAVVAVANEIVDIADEPIGDSSLVPTLLVSRMARDHVKVALSADGADELFGGYARYSYVGKFVQQPQFVRGLYYMSAEVLDSLPAGMLAAGYALSRAGGPKFAAINDKLRKFVRMARARGQFESYVAAVSEWTSAEARRLLAQQVPAASHADRTTFEAVKVADPRERFMHFDLVRYLPGDLLTKVDRASMATSLEAREPFLDHEMAALAAVMPVNWKMRGGQNKYVLRRLLARYFPASLFDRPKQGFSAPVREWLRGPLRPVLQDLLSSSEIRRQGILDPATVTNALGYFLSGDKRTTSAASIWILLQLQQWSRRWVNA